MEIREYCCSVILKLNDNLSWTFPVRVITEASVPQKELTFSTLCRKTKKEVVVLPLPGLASMTEDDEFDVELLSVQEYEFSVIKNWFVVSPENVKFLA